MMARSSPVPSSVTVSSSGAAPACAPARSSAAGTSIGRYAFVDAGVRIGANCKLQNNCLVYAPASIGDGVFIGPAAILTNDRHPRAATADGITDRRRRLGRRNR